MAEADLKSRRIRLEYSLPDEAASGRMPTDLSKCETPTPFGPWRRLEPGDSSKVVGHFDPRSIGGAEKAIYNGPFYRWLRKFLGGRRS